MTKEGDFIYKGEQRREEVTKSEVFKCCPNFLPLPFPFRFRGHTKLTSIIILNFLTGVTSFLKRKSFPISRHLTPSSSFLTQLEWDEESVGLELMTRRRGSQSLAAARLKSGGNGQKRSLSRRVSCWTKRRIWKLRLQSPQESRFLKTWNQRKEIFSL